MVNKHKLTLLFLAAIVSFGFINAPQAAPGGGGSTEIVEVIPNYEAAQLTILGNELSDGITPPIVTLGGFSLIVTDFDASMIQADADLSAYVAGDYLLTVNPNYKKAKEAKSLLTLGTVGPEGPEGPEGPPYNPVLIVGKWYPTSNDGSSSTSGDGFWDWDAEEFNTNPTALEWTAGIDYITVRGDLFPGYYEVCWKLTYGYISESAWYRTLLRISGSIVSDTLSGGAAYVYKPDVACQIWYSTSNQTMALEADSVDTDYVRYGASGPRYSWMTIKRLN